MRVDPAVLGVVACGGAVGTLARYGLGALFPVVPGSFPWTTLAVNTLGCLLIGALVGWLTASAPHRLAGPFLSTGVLGGFTTFSAFAVDVETLIRLDRPGTALAYLVATPTLALAAVSAGTALIRRVRPVPAAPPAGEDRG